MLVCEGGIDARPVVLLLEQNKGAGFSRTLLSKPHSPLVLPNSINCTLSGQLESNTEGSSLVPPFA